MLFIQPSTSNCDGQTGHLLASDYWHYDPNGFTSNAQFASYSYLPYAGPALGVPPFIGYSDSSLVNANLAMFQYYQAPDLPLSYFPYAPLPQNVYSATVPLCVQCHQPYCQCGIIVNNSASNNNTEHANIFSNECALVKVHSEVKRTRKWTGELDETMNASHYECRFEIDPQTFVRLVTDLKKLYCSNVYIVDDIPTYSSSGLVVYFKSDYFLEKVCQHLDQHGHFFHPQEGYRLPVYIKALDLLHSLTAGRQPRMKLSKWKLYVHGLDRMFSADDLFQIYNDLYDTAVLWVRIFPDRAGYPFRGALVIFSRSKAYDRALQDEQVIVKTCKFTRTLCNKKYICNGHPQVEQHRQQAEESLQDRKESKHCSTFDYVHTGQDLQSTEPNGSQLTAGLKMKLFFASTAQRDKQRLQRIRKETRQSDHATRYTSAKQDILTYRRLSFINYLSD